MRKWGGRRVDKAMPSISRFPLGRILATKNATLSLSAIEIHLALSRHNAGDWGIVDEDDRKANEFALQNGERLFSVYRSEAGEKFYVITEWDRSATTVLLLKDY
jgi:hypothetical protein